MRTYENKDELKNEINKSFAKYISEFDIIPESLKDKRVEEVDRTPAENLAYQVGWTTLVLKWESDERNGLHGGGFRTDGRVEEIDGVVGNAHEKARNGQDSQNNDDNGVDFAHVRDFLHKISDKFTLKIRMDRLRRSLLTLN